MKMDADLNLLRTLDVLLQERSVTRAALRLNLSQPAVSAQLRQLRERFGDPLLVGGRHGMLPTARATGLQASLHEALESVVRAVRPEQPFEPATAEHTWRVDASDNAAAAILLPVLARLPVLAPRSRLAVLDEPPARIGELAERGDIGLALHTVEDAPPGLRMRTLHRERYLLAGRAGHPALKRRPTAAQFCRLAHVVVSPDGGGFRGPTDEALAARGLRRQVALSVPHFLVVMAVLAAGDLVAMLPSRLVANVPGLRVVEPPVEVPGYEMAMLWHERVHRDPAEAWLRERIVEAAGG